ncbi:lysophospholipase L1-like esterase [Microbacterium terrae]|uniref:Rhamnogalacturonan acetylesterase RhgT n=1 Tax=Microbacterium terrae TaxID=69369 RepID=A0A0M2HJH3_9MICO|nr:rhamnogalacturonan acetylesterase [Microbacterium terrae]KJL44508.1 Rhamnogalacturonan acetylesterase RhgT [Microbacterium terrae]MBP1079489.1 lysophospholipase L1-like esterase [Microbacterium terrae]GLJ96830.1 lysophospholipase L1-like esterase [Microbacterium terrae]
MTYLLAGDSTVASMKPGEEPMAGWGECLHEFVDASVRNFAFGGATTESFIQFGSWASLLETIVPGDTVVIQFGHNDQREPALLGSRGGYAERLRGFVQDLSSGGATAVLCTPVERRWFDGDRVTPTHGDYPNAVRDLALDLDIPLIDLTAFTTWLYEDLGDEESRALLSHYAPGETIAWRDGLVDNTHFRIDGARRIAAFVAKSLRAIERRDGDQPAKGIEIVGGVG